MRSGVSTKPTSVSRGLRGVAVAETRIGDVRGQEGFYHYRQYDAVELAEKLSFEAVWHLVHQGDLPSATELGQFSRSVSSLRDVSGPLLEMLRFVASTVPSDRPLEALRAALSILVPMERHRPWIDLLEADRQRAALRLCAVTPVIVASLYRLGSGREPVPPDPELGFAANYLWMLEGTRVAPDRVRALEQYLILTIDHGFNASTFTTRVITSTGADLGSAVIGAIGALSGPLHGGAPSRALEMVDHIGAADRIDAYIEAALSHGDRLMGFGHPVYRTEDPRSRMLRGVAEHLGGARVALAKQVEARALELLREHRPERQLHTNVEFYAALVMESVGLPPNLFTPTFVLSRMIGWTAHALEQMLDNQVIRPSAAYVGPEPHRTVPRAS